MARKTQCSSTRQRLDVWMRQADSILAEIDKAEANNSRVRRVAR